MIVLESKKVDMKGVSPALKHTVNILATVLAGAVAFFFFSYGFSYRSLPLIDKKLLLLISVS